MALSRAQVLVLGLGAATLLATLTIDTGATAQGAASKRAPAASHARVMPISPAPGNATPRPELQPFKTTRPTRAVILAMSVSLTSSTVRSS